MWKPYVYLIGWSKLNVYYVGVRYSKNSFLGDIWKTYFTSSKYVHNFKDNNGDPDIIEILESFNTKEEAIDYENNYIKDNNLVESNNWLNRHYHSAKFVNPGGWKHTDKWKNEARKRAKKNCDHLKGYWKGKTRSKEWCLSMSNIMKGKIHTEDTKRKMSESKMGTKNPKSKHIIVEYNGEILKFDSYAALCKHLKISRNSISKWKNRGIPKRLKLSFISPL